MAWARISNSFDDDPKVLALLEHDGGVRAAGLWTVCLTWASRHRHPSRPAHIPNEIPAKFDPQRGVELAGLLVHVGMWTVCDDGWLFTESDLFEWGPMDGRRSYIPRWLRRLIHTRDGWRCLKCGSPEDLTLDHIQPWSLGGPDTEDNLRTLCRSCNSSKGARV
ncbi:HNH endonuclease [Streptosporangium sp. NPDC001559]|uniref:HNH endonuclease n=1 Tax=Streptosporangium sp. NPDC001559 TaxID=3366187 RepID=UPI0036EE3385